LAEIGIPGSATYAQTLSGLEAMLDVLPDNDANLISARDMRDVVFTLYGDLQGGSFSEFVYTDTPSTVVVGGMPENQIFASMSLFTIFNLMFHKDKAPEASLAFVGISETQYEFKQPGSPEYILALTNTGVPNPNVAAVSGFDELIRYQLRWTATKRTNDFQNSGTITRTPTPAIPEKDGNPLFDVFVPSGGGTDLTSETRPRINQSNTYVFTCRDIKGVAATGQVSLSYGLKYYLGEVSTRNLPTSAQIRDLALSANNGGQSNSGKFSTTFRGSYKDHGGNDKFLIWCFPSSFGTPKFFQFQTQLWTGPAFVGTVNYKNIFGYETNYDVWITQSKYNSPVSAYIIT